MMMTNNFSVKIQIFTGKHFARVNEYLGSVEVIRLALNILLQSAENRQLAPPFVAIHLFGNVQLLWSIDQR